jgi:hypothetical protein
MIEQQQSYTTTRSMEYDIPKEIEEAQEED